MDLAWAEPKIKKVPAKVREMGLIHTAGQAGQAATTCRRNNNHELTVCEELYGVKL